MTNAPAYFDIWKDIVTALRARASEISGLEIIEQPARTLAIRPAESNQPTVQASISLSGDAIAIRRASTDSNFPVDETPEVIEIEVKNGTVRYVHDDLDSTADTRAVADMILAPILETRRKPQAEKSPKDEAPKKRNER